MSFHLSCLLNIVTTSWNLNPARIWSVTHYQCSPTSHFGQKCNYFSLTHHLWSASHPACVSGLLDARKIFFFRASFRILERHTHVPPRLSSPTPPPGERSVRHWNHGDRWPPCDRSWRVGGLDRKGAWTPEGRPSLPESRMKMYPKGQKKVL